MSAMWAIVVSRPPLIEAQTIDAVFATDGNEN